jgi:hypothetical protein
MLLQRSQGATAKVAADVSLIDSKTGQTTRLLNFELSTEQVERMEWIPGSSTGVVLLSRLVDGKPTSSLFLISEDSGLAKEFEPWRKTFSQGHDVIIAPDASFAVATGYQGEKAAAMAIRPDGSSTRIELPQGPLDQISFDWATDGKTLLAVRFREDAGETKVQWFSLNAQGGKPEAIPDPARLCPFTRRLPEDFDLVVRSVPARDQWSAAPISEVWAESDRLDQPKMISGSATWGELSPSRDAIAFISNGSLFVRTLVPVDRKMYEAAKIQEEKTAAMLASRDIATAALDYAGANGNMLPTPNEFQERLKGYVKDPGLLKNFVWTFQGGSIEKLGSNTEIGFIALPGGRCVCYLGGHAVWVADKP